MPVEVLDVCGAGALSGEDDDACNSELTVTPQLWKPFEARVLKYSRPVVTASDNNCPWARNGTSYATNQGHT